MSNQSIPIKKATKSGLDNVLWLNIYYDKNQNGSAILMINIHNNTQLPATVYRKGDFIESGSYVYFMIKRLYDQKLKLP